MRFFTPVTVIFAAVLAALAAPAPAQAAKIKIRVWNDAGLPQTAVSVFKGGQTEGLPAARTVLGGIATLKVNPGDQLVISGIGNKCKDKRGRVITYSVPDPVPTGEVDVTIPQLEETKNLPAQARGLSAAERRLVGKINAFRAKHGLEPMQISSTLSAGAFIRWTRLRKPNGEKKDCPSLATVLGDLGWGTPTGSYFAYWGIPAAPSLETFMDYLRSDAMARSEMLDSGIRYVGVSLTQNAWGAVFGSYCSTRVLGEEACGLTGDFGIPPKGSIGGDGAEGTGSAAPRLRLAQAKQKGKRVKLIYRIKRGASGKVRFALKDGRRERTLRAKRRPGRYIVRVRARRGMRWASVIASFAPRDGRWKQASVCKRVKLKRTRGKRARQWVAVKVRSCRAR